MQRITFTMHAIDGLFRNKTSYMVVARKKITEGMATTAATNPVSKPFSVLVDIPCMPRRKFREILPLNLVLGHIGIVLAK